MSTCTQTWPALSNQSIGVHGHGHKYYSDRDTMDGVALKVTTLATSTTVEGGGAGQAQEPAPVAPATTATPTGSHMHPGGGGNEGDPEDPGQGGAELPPTTGGAPFPTGMQWDWTARVRFREHELGRSFAVWLFLGSVPENVEEWAMSPDQIGCVCAYVSVMWAGQDAYCSEPADVADNQGFVHLNGPIMTHTTLGSLEPEVVVPYLTKELHWRVEKMDGTAAQLKSLEVTVLATPMTFPPGADTIVYGEPRRFNAITHGRPGGSHQE